MGGSCGSGEHYGGSGGDNDENSIQPKIEETRTAVDKAEINDYLQGLLNDINQRDTETINYRKDEILKVIEDEFEGSFDISTGGSYSKHTYVDGLSDVDILIDVGNYSDSQIPDKENSKSVLQYVADRLKQRYPKTEITVGKMAVTLKFSDGKEIQVLPAFKYHNGYKIPDPDSNNWITTNPHKFKEKLTKINQDNGGSVKPVIKLVKYLCEKNCVPIKSYHLENIAIDAFKDYNGPYNRTEMVKYLLNHAKTRVLKRIEDPSGQTDYADEYLGKGNSSQRKQLAKKISKLEQKIENAKTKDDWEKSFNGQ